MDNSQTCRARADLDRANADLAVLPRAKEVLIRSAERWEEMAAIAERVEAERLIRDEMTRARAVIQHKAKQEALDRKAAKEAVIVAEVIEPEPEVQEVYLEAAE